MLNTILEKLHLQPEEQEESEKQIDYDPYKRPPDLEIARKHSVASKFAKAKLEQANSKENLDMCPCCGLPILIEELNICCPRSDFNFNGAGIALYFEFLMFGVILLLIYGLVSGIYNFYYNAVGQNCYYQNMNQTKNQFTCNENLFNMFSLSNRHKSLDPLGSGLNLLTSIAIMVGTLYYRKQIKITTTEIDNTNIAVSDYSIQINNLPKETNELEIQRFFTKNIGRRKNFFEFRKICMGYNIAPYTKLLNQKLVKQKALGTLLDKMRHKSTQDLELQEQDLQQQLKDLQRQIDYYESNLDTSFQFSGVAFLTYNRQKQVDALREYYKVTKFQVMIMQISGIFHIENPRKFKGQILYVNKAPEPGDILWENLGVGLWEQLFYRIITNIATFFVLSICFGIILGVSIGQAYINLSNTGTTTSYTTAVAITMLGLVASLLISTINIVLGFVIRKFAQIEKHSTQTEFNISVAKKLGIAQFLNTAMITLIVNFTMGTAQTLRSQLWINGGLNSDVILILLTNAIFPLIQVLFDPFYLLRLYKRRRSIVLGENCNYTQKEANEFFEGPKLDLAKKYAQATKTLMVTMFYVYLLPLGIPIAMFSLILIYWLEKTFLIKRDSKPPPVGDDLAEQMVNFYIELVLIVFGTGCCVWEVIVFREIHPLTYIQLIFAILYYILPIDLIFEGFLHVEEAQTRQSYDEKQHTFWDDYDRRNPITMQKALEEWMNQQSDNKQMKKKMMIKFYKQQRKNLEEREMDISNSYNNNYRSGRMRNVKTSNSPLKNQRIIKNNQVQQQPMKQEEQMLQPDTSLDQNSLSFQNQVQQENQLYQPPPQQPPTFNPIPYGKQEDFALHQGEYKIQQVQTLKE